MEEMKIVNVTPEYAESILQHNSQNRKLRNPTVERYAHDMKSGRWEESNRTPIVIDEDGELKDGQHRLSAVVKSGVSINFLIVTGVSRDTHIFDRGAVRSTYDIACMAGYDISKEVIETAKSFINRLARTGFIKNDFMNIATDSNYLDYCDKQMDVLKNAVNIAKGTKNFRLDKRAYRTVAYIGLLNGIDEDILVRFFQVLSSGFYDDESEKIIILLRNKIIETKNKGGFFGGYVGESLLISYCERVLYMYYRQESVSRLMSAPFTKMTQKAYEKEKINIEKCFK